MRMIVRANGVHTKSLFQNKEEGKAELGSATQQTAKSKEKDREKEVEAYGVQTTRKELTEIAKRG
jgi:hypothetical protein